MADINPWSQSWTYPTDMDPRPEAGPIQTLNSRHQVLRLRREGGTCFCTILTSVSPPGSVDQEGKVCNQWARRICFWNVWTRSVAGCTLLLKVNLFSESLDWIRRRWHAIDENVKRFSESSDWMCSRLHPIDDRVNLIS
ncbi:uncharacterized protein RBU33_016294 isoform 1-T4 [Hipposideros larvatus]